MFLLLKTEPKGKQRRTDGGNRYNARCLGACFLDSAILPSVTVGQVNVSDPIPDKTRKQWSALGAGVRRYAASQENDRP
jgi:hypothetical protein